MDAGGIIGTALIGIFAVCVCSAIAWIITAATAEPEAPCAWGDIIEIPHDAKRATSQPGGMADVALSQIVAHDIAHRGEGR